MAYHFFRIMIKHFFVYSIGNFFFAGARIFFQSLDSAIFLFSRVSDIPSESLILPVISTNDRFTLGCELWVCKCKFLFTLVFNVLLTFKYLGNVQ